jgi:hypothetical protein
MAIEEKAKATIYFMDGSRMRITYPRQSGKNSLALATAVGKAIDREKLAVSNRSKLVVIPTRNIKYIEISPPPDSLPDTIIRDAEIS